MTKRNSHERRQRRHRRQAREAITALFESVVDLALRDEKRIGCLLVNTAVEMAAHDKDIRAAVARGLEETESFFQDLLEAGQNSGEISGTIDAKHTASALLGLLIGLRVLARSRPQRQAMQPLAQQAKALLN